MKHVAHLPGVLSADELQVTGEHLASLQLDTGMIPMTEPETRLTLKAPGGLVGVTARCANG